MDLVHGDPQARNSEADRADTGRVRVLRIRRAGIRYLGIGGRSLPKLLSRATLGIKALTSLQWFLVGALALGVFAHALASLSGRPLWDGALYSYMGGSIYSSGSLQMDWDPTHVFPTWEYGIIYPVFLSLFYHAASFSSAASQTAAFVASLLLMGAGYWATKDLFGRTKGFAMAALLSLDPTLLNANSHNYADPFLLALFILALWGLLKSLKDDRYMVAFGVGAGLFYMSRTIIGWSYVVPGLVGLLAWHWWKTRPSWAAFRWWIAGAGLVMAFVILREFEIQIEGRVFNTHDVSYVLGNTGALLPVAGLKLPFLVLMVASYGVFWLPELRMSLSARRQPDHEVLLLGAAGLGAVIWALISMIAVTEPQNPIFWQDNMRYVLVIVVPVVWLIFMHLDFDMRDTGHVRQRVTGHRLPVKFVVLAGIAGLTLVFIGAWLAVFVGFGAIALLGRSCRQRLAIMLLVFALAGLNTLTAVDQPGFVAAAATLNARVRPGDVIAIDRHSPPDLNAVEVYNYVREHDIVVIDYAPGTNATFIMSQFAVGENVIYPGYALVGSCEGNYERTWLAQLTYPWIGKSSVVAGEIVQVWESNSALARRTVGGT